MFASFEHFQKATGVASRTVGAVACVGGLLRARLGRVEHFAELLENGIDDEHRLEVLERTKVDLKFTIGTENVVHRRRRLNVIVLGVFEET